MSSHDARIVQFFTNTGAAPGAHGRARFEERSDRTDFDVEVEHLPIGTCSLVVDGIERTLDVVTSAEGGETEVEFRSPVEPGKILLDFDPRGKEIDVVQNGTTFLTELFPTEAGSGNGGGHGGGRCGYLQRRSRADSGAPAIVLGRLYGFAKRSHPSTRGARVPLAATPRKHSRFRNTPPAQAQRTTCIVRGVLPHRR